MPSPRDRTPRGLVLTWRMRLATRDPHTNAFSATGKDDPDALVMLRKALVAPVGRLRAAAPSSPGVSQPARARTLRVLPDRS
jgi:hypothetical protein